MSTHDHVYVSVQCHCSFVHACARAHVVVCTNMISYVLLLLWFHMCLCASMVACARIYTRDYMCLWLHVHTRDGMLSCV